MFWLAWQLLGVVIVLAVLFVAGSIAAELWDRIKERNYQAALGAILLFLLVGIPAGVSFAWLLFHFHLR